MAKRNERVAPPALAGEWELRFGTTEAANGWEDLCSQAPGPTREAWETIGRDPRDRTRPHRQHQLRDKLANREVKGLVLEQWQFEPTGGGRIWYCPDDSKRIVWLVAATSGHPRRTDR